MSAIELYGSLCIHWALGGFVLVTLAASEYSGAGTLVALPVTAIAITSAALSDKCKPTKTLSHRKNCTNLLTFLKIWLDILEHLVAAATCARVASATVDYTSDRRLRQWLFGIESHSLGEPWPDVLGVSIIIIVSTLFMLGLEKSVYFCTLLIFGISTSLVFFVGVGGYHTDISFWNWTEDFTNRSWGSFLTTAALCSFGFVSTFPCALLTKRIKIAALVVVPLIAYCLIATIFTLMSHYREVAGIAIPLVRVFELRDVDWARPIMAVLTICVVCLVLTEIMPSLHNLLVKLAGNDWKVFVSPILYRHSLTGAPVLAIFTAGSLASILAFACPLSYLVRMLNIAVLYKCALKSIFVMYRQFKVEATQDYNQPSSDVRYSMLSRKPPRTSKSFYDMLPGYLKKTKVTVTTSDLANGNSTTRSRKNSSGDKEYLLLNQYSSSNLDLMADPDSESEQSVETPNMSEEADESGSSTDIDEIVQEYKDRVQVATVNTFSSRRGPSKVSGRLACLIVILLCGFSTSLSVAIILEIAILEILATVVVILLLIPLCALPQNPITDEERPLTKSPTTLILTSYLSIILNIMLATTLLLEIWPAILLWTVAGLLFYAKCNFCSCLEENKDRIRICHSKTECSVPDTTSVVRSKMIKVDSILIPR